MIRWSIIKWRFRVDLRGNSRVFVPPQSSKSAVIPSLIRVQIREKLLAPLLRRDFDDCRELFDLDCWIGNCGKARDSGALVFPSRNMQMINCGAGGPGHYKDFMYFRAVEHAGLNTIRRDEWVELGWILRVEITFSLASVCARCDNL